MKKIFLISIILISHIITAGENNPYTVKIFTKEAVNEFLPFVATIRINIFKEYPYLYEGNFDEEMVDLESCAQLTDNAIAIAYHHETPVGFLYGIPLVEFAPHFENPVVELFNDKKLSPETCYYFADIIILPEHRGKNLSKKLFDALETYAQEQGYTSASFITESHDIHPLKPLDYKSLDPLWSSLQYKKTGLTSYGSWQTHQPDGSIARQRHSAEIWFKNLKK